MNPDIQRYAMLVGNVGIVKQIQHVSVTITPGNSTGTSNISSINPDCTLILFNGRTCTGTNTTSTSAWAGISGITSTTITAEQTGTAYGHTVYVTLIEFYPWAVKSSQIRQRTSVTGETSIFTETIPSVDLSRSVLTFLGNTLNVTSSSSAARLLSVNLTQSNEVTFRREGTSDNASVTVFYQVFEFAHDVLASPPQRLRNWGAGSPISFPISPVNRNAAIVINNGQETSDGQAAPARSYCYFDLNADDNVNGYSFVTSVVTGKSATVIEFLPKYIKSCQRGVINIPSGQNIQTESISSVDVSKSLLNMTGLVFNGTTGSTPERYLTALKIDSSIQLSSFLNSGSTAAADINVGYEILQFR